MSALGFFSLPLHLFKHQIRHSYERYHSYSTRARRSHMQQIYNKIICSKFFFFFYLLLLFFGHINVDIRSTGSRGRDVS